MDNELKSNKETKIVVIGVGGGGGNAINNMVDSTDNKNVKFIAVNTDAQDLEKSKAHVKILIVAKNKDNIGLGAGTRPEVGADAAMNCLPEIEKELEGANLCFVSAGLGGGTGTGAAPVIAEFAKKEKNITTFAFVTKPFFWEGRKRRENAEAGLEKLLKATDSLIEIPNDKLINVSNKKTTLNEAFKAADSILRDGVLGVTDVITKPGIINLDFADVQAVIKDAGKAHMGIGLYTATGDEDENPVVKALVKAIESPLLETTIDGATRIIINYSSSEELHMLHIAEANEMVYEKADENVNLVWGASTDSTLGEGEIKVTVIASEFNKKVSKEFSKIDSGSKDKETTKVNPMSEMIGSVDSSSKYSTMASEISAKNMDLKDSNKKTNKEEAASVPKSFDANRFRAMFKSRN